MPIVSVIIPSYNRADMLPDAIRSVLNQSFSDWELIIVDDGSTDSTREVAASFAVMDERIQYIYQENTKLPGARNTGIRASQGKYIAFLDSDDVFLPHKLKTQVAALDEHPELGLVAGGFFEVDRGLNILRELRPWETQPVLALKDWVLSCPFCPGAPLIRREWLDKADLFDEKMPFVEDWDLWLRMSSLGCPMDWTRMAVCYYRIHGGNMVRQAALMKNGMLTMFDKLYVQMDLPQEILDLKNEAYSNAYVNGAARALGGGDGPEGLACLEKAIEVNPMLLEGNPPQVISRLASFALTPLCGDADGFMRLLAEHLPDALRIRRWNAVRLRGTLRAVAAFDANERGKYKEVVRNAIRAVKDDPQWMQNRGFVKMIFHALMKN